jgi:hypothetical protein
MPNTNTFTLPFPSTSANPCVSSSCSPATGCLVCGYDLVLSCPPSGNCVDYFKQQNITTQFLNGYVTGFSGKLGLGGSESNVNIDLVVQNNECAPTGVSCSPCPAGSGYDGRLGYLYTFSMGQFCFRGILSNHTYSEDSSGYKYRLTLSDGRSILSNIVVILNTIYDRPPPELEHNVLNAVYFLEKSVDDCDGANKCADFMKSGANTKGIFFKRALKELNKKQIKIPISKVCLTLELTKLINIVPENYRTTNTEMSLLDLVSLVCDECGYDFLVEITQDNKLDIIPIDYTKTISGTPLLNLINNLSIQNNVISKEYGEEMTFEKNKRLVFGGNYQYITTISDVVNASVCPYVPPQLNDAKCAIVNPPSSKLVTRNTDEPILASSSPEPSCTP